MRFIYSYRKMAILFTNSGDPDQTPHSAASDLVCTVCQLSFYGSPDYNGLNKLVLEGVCSLENFIAANKTKSLIFFLYVFFVSNGKLLDFYC